jgi:hypothetical protein
LTPSVQEIDPEPHFAALFALLETVVATKDYANPAIDRAVAVSAAAARAAGIAPERVLAYLRIRLNQAPLSAVGDWYRSVLVERLIARTIEAYFAAPDSIDG